MCVTGFNSSPIAQQVFMITLMCVITYANNNNENTNLPCQSISYKYTERYLSTKTPYRVVANLNAKPKNFKGCHPTRQWAVIRHGTRNPSKEIIRQANDVLMSIKNQILFDNRNVSLCSKHLNMLKQWQLNLSLSDNKNLANEGEDELVKLAQRWKQRFPILMSAAYNPQMYFFMSTERNRTRKSAENFAAGLFGTQNVTSIINNDQFNRDHILRVSIMK